MNWRNFSILVALILLQSCIHSKKPETPPDQLQPDRHREILGSVLADTRSRAEQTLSQLTPEARADAVNALAWFDQRMDDLVLTRDARGVVTRLSGRSLAFEFAPKSTGDLQAKADSLLVTGKTGHVLLNLPAGADIRRERTYFENDSGAKYLYQQLHQGHRVRDAVAVIKLDPQGRLQDIESSLVGYFSAAEPAGISQQRAVAIAIQDLKTRKAPFWEGVEPQLERVELVIVDLLPFSGEIATARAFAVFLKTPEDRIGGYREVLVNEATGEVIASIEKTDLMLNRNDRIIRASGTIGRGAGLTTDVLWFGEPGECPAPDSTTAEATVLERDIGETKAAMCEIVRFFAERGGEFGSSDFRDWIDPTGSGLRAGVGATPELSIGIRIASCVSLYALGAARLDILGHEFGHCLFDSGTLAAFTGAGRDGGAIEEHLGDVLGLFLERRYANRVEDRCLLSDDPDTLDAIGAITPGTTTPCRGARAPWRSYCQPQQANGGWCEGPAFHTDKGFIRYDIGYDSDHSGGFGLSHTNLGIGNQLMSALLGDSGSRRYLDSWLVTGLGQRDSERLFLAAAIRLPVNGIWPAYAQAFIDGATAISGATPISPMEVNVRNAMASGRIWSMPRLAGFESAGGTPSMAAVTATERPAVASIVLPDGRERTYVFFRQAEDFRDRAVYYAWRDEIPGGRFADTEAATFTGPCRLADAETYFSPAAAGKDDLLHVAWSHPGSDPEMGTVRGLRLQAEDAAASGCEDDWEDHPPGFRPGSGGEEPTSVERRLRGSPALALWTTELPAVIDGGPEETIRCLPIPGIPEPPNYPFYPIGPLGPDFGFNICNLLRPQQPPWPLPGPLTQRLRDLMVPELDSNPARAIPSVLDPLAPPRQLQNVPVQHRYALNQRLRADEQFATEFADLMSDIAVAAAGTGEFADSQRTPISSPGIPNPFGPSGINYRFGSRYILPNGLPEITLGGERTQLILGFRDPDDDLRVVGYDDDRPTDDAAGMPLIPRLAENINPADPALTTVTMSRGAEYLTVVYGVRHNGNPTGLAYRTLTAADSAGSFTAGDFTSARRLDQFRNIVHTRRVRDYAYLRSLNTPVIAGGKRQLHLFTTELNQGFPADGSIGDPGYDPFPDASGRRPNGDDHIRYTLLNMNASGVLLPVSERPVRLSNTRIARPRVTDTQAGAAQLTQHRSQIRFFWPNEIELTLRSRPLL